MAGAAMSIGREWVRIVLMVPGLLAIFAFGEALLDRHPVRLDLTTERRHSLTDQTIRVLDGLTADVRVIAFLRSPDPRRQPVEDLLRQAQARSGHVSLQVLDVNRSPALARQYGISSYGAVVVESEGRRRVFTSPSEEILVAAILQVTRQQRKTIGWVVGHGEGDLSSGDRHFGFSTVHRLLEQEYYDVRPVSLGNDVPPETAVLVIAGPQKDFLPGEISAFDRYMQRPGLALVLLDPHRAPRLAEALGGYGIALRDDVVVDPDRRLYRGEGLTLQIPFSPEDHPLLAPLTAPPLFSLSRSVGVVARPEASTAGTVFLRTGQDSWSSEGTRTDDVAPEFVAGRDRRGPLGVGAEVAFTVETPPGREVREGRIITYGNAQFANNFFIEYLGNKDLFANTINWLAYEHQAIAHRPERQEPGVGQLFISEEEGRSMFIAAAIVQPGVFALVGLALAARRRWG